MARFSGDTRPRLPILEDRSTLPIVRSPAAANASLSWWLMAVGLRQPVGRALYAQEEAVQPDEGVGFAHARRAGGRSRVDDDADRSAASDWVGRAGCARAASGGGSGERARPVESTAQQTASQPPSFGLPLAESFEQMQSQAAQLAAQLRKQQATIDHREAEVNARAAAVESQVRTARLWLLEKLEELAQRKAELSSAAADIAMQSPSDDTPQPPSGQARARRRAGWADARAWSD